MAERRGRRGLRAAWLAWVGGLLASVQALAAPVPPVLEPWRDWALHGQAAATCTPVDGSPQCAWPGALQLDVGRDGLAFVQTWTLQAEQRIPLPGDDRLRPTDVRAGGVPVPVVLADGVPQALLAAGTHRVDGRITWPRRPATLPVPASIALVALRIDGAAVAVPERNDDDALVLGSDGAGESDALQIETYRLLADGVPQLLATQVVLSVSGRPREQVLGTVLPEGFVPVLLDGEVPARIEADGTLRAQLRPGTWSLLLIARAAAPLAAFRMPAPAADSPLPAQEIWQFRADPQFRLAQFTGVPGVDPMQAGVPSWHDVLDDDAAADAWQALLADADTLPAFLLDADSTATLEVQLRGLPAHRPARLSLQRELWLGFDGEGYLAQDSIRGELGSAQRLDMQAPWQLERAALVGGAPQLVTQGGDAALSGVELREPAVALDTGARATRNGELPANGWTQPFDSARTVLHLPPGYRLLGATGADRAHGSWWDAWSLLDLFLLSLFALMAWRLGGVALGAGLVAWVLLAWHEPLAPRVSLLAAVALTLLARHLPAGRIARGVGWIRNAVLVLLAVLVLPFAADQLRMALYPQLEHVGTGTDRGDVVQVSFNEAPAEMAPPPPPAPPAPGTSMIKHRAESTSLDSITVTGSRIKRTDLFSYPADTIAQAGSARPVWRWHDHHLEWNGPLLVDQPLGLVVSPPWLTRSWRVLAVLLLGFVLWRMLRARTATPATRRGAVAAPAWLLAATLAGAGLAPSAADAQAGTQAIPSTELLDALRQRLVERNAPCEPACAGLGAVLASADAERLVLQLDAQAQADIAWPLPQPDASLHLAAVRVDGVEAAVLRDDDGAWVALPRGVHRVEATYAASGERWRIAFPLAPATLDVRADGFELAGLDDGRLIGDTLDLVPPRRVDATQAADNAPNESVPPFVRVQREITLDQQWHTATTVRRVAPLRSGLTVAIPLLPGEQLTGADPAGALPPVRNGQAIVSLPAGVDAITWHSRLTPADRIALVAGDGRGYGEEWRLAVAPLLHVQTDGIPEAGQDDPDGLRFLPLPGETLTIAVSRPAAVDGASVAIEHVSLDVEPGQHARNSTLAFTLRATRAGQHVLALPADAELLGVSIGGQPQPLLPDGGKLALPLRTEPQHVEIRWREPIAIGSVLHTPTLSLGAAAANIDLALDVPSDRWLLFTTGPRVGPAVLFWSGLAVMLLAAVVLARIGRTPLRLHAWLLLGLGFSAISWWPAVLVAGWLLLVGWRARQPGLMARRNLAMAVQVGLVLATGIALLCLLLAIPYGLLGQPDMHVVGNQSWGGTLRWFADRSADGTLPVATAITLPLWCYKLAILLWSLWLASALMQWLRWTWASLNTGGLWPAKAVRGDAAEAPMQGATPAPTPTSPQPTAST